MRAESYRDQREQHQGDEEDEENIHRPGSDPRPERTDEARRDAQKRVHCGAE
jgi:hypothetical protein